LKQSTTELPERTANLEHIVVVPGVSRFVDEWCQWTYEVNMMWYYHKDVTV